MDELDSLLEDLNDNNMSSQQKGSSTKIDIDELDDLMNTLNDDNSNYNDYNNNNTTNYNDYNTNQSKDVSDELDDLLDGLSSSNDNPPPKPTKQPVKQTPPTKVLTKTSVKQPVKQQSPKMNEVDSTLDDLDLLMDGLNSTNTSSNSRTTVSSNQNYSNTNTLDELDELMNGLETPPRTSNVPQDRNSQLPTKSTRQSNVPTKVMPKTTKNITDDLDDLLLDMDNLSTNDRPSQQNFNQPQQNRQTQVMNKSSQQNFNQSPQQNRQTQNQSFGGGDDLDDLLLDMDNLSNDRNTQVNNRPSQQNFNQPQQNRQTQVMNKSSQQNFNQSPQQNRQTQNQFSNNMNRPSQQNFNQTQSQTRTSGFPNNPRSTQSPKVNQNFGGGDDLDDLLGEMEDFTPNRTSNQNFNNQSFNNMNRQTQTNPNFNNMNRQTQTNNNFTSMNRPSNNNLNNMNRPSNNNFNTVNNQMQMQSGPQRGICGGCNQPIYGQVLQALGRSWHPEHFTCGNCNSELGTSSFYEQEGKPHCENCYQQLFCPRCAACDQPITNRVITALGKKWHPEHFVCTTCNAPFGGGSFYERGGYPYCQEHYYNSSSSSKCAGCQNTIQGDFVNAIGQQWHTSCFVCQYCHKAFTNGQFYEMNGMPYCEIHYYSNTGSMCGACNKPITGKAVNALGKSWHPEHFVCGFCYNPIGGGNYTEKDGKAFCSECYTRLYS